jgi:hypothetical protein
MKESLTAIEKSVEKTKVETLQEKIDRFYHHLRAKHGDSEVLREAAYFFPFIVKQHYSNEFEKIIKDGSKS